MSGVAGGGAVMGDENDADEFSDRDEIMLNALSAGLTHAEAGGMAGLSAKSVQRRLRNARFRAEVARRRMARVEALSGRLTTLGQTSLSVLERAMASHSLPLAVRASDVTLRHLFQFRRAVELEQALAVAEALGEDTADDTADIADVPEDPA